jgi:hypothetical protein
MEVLSAFAGLMIAVGFVHVVAPRATSDFYHRYNAKRQPIDRLWNWPPDPRTARLMGLGFVLFGTAAILSAVFRP